MVKRLSIRLDDVDLAFIQHLSKVSHTDCIAKNIKFALEHASSYYDLVTVLRHSIKTKLYIEPEDLESLRDKLPYDSDF